MRLVVLLLTLALPALVGLGTARAQRPGDVVGNYALEVSVAPATVHVEEPIVLRVRISGSGPAQSLPRRKDVQFPPDWSRDFYTLALPAEDRADAAAGVWEYVYRLKPKRVGVLVIGGVKLPYYNPMRRRYQTAYQEADVTLKVLPTAAPREDWQVAAAAAPALLCEIADDANVLATTSERALPALAWLTLFALTPPALCWLGYRAARRRWPDTATRERRRRSAAARRALARLDASTDCPWLVIGDYLRERLGATAAEPTPGEMQQLLIRRGLARAVGEQVRAFFATCDAVRFGADSVAREELRAAAVKLIAAVEGDRCLA